MPRDVYLVLCATFESWRVCGDLSDEANSPSQSLSFLGIRMIQLFHFCSLRENYMVVLTLAEIDRKGLGGPSTAPHVTTGVSETLV